MILAGNQPYFIPYIGYWQIINAADCYTIADDFNYIERGWINRNRVLTNKKEWAYLNIEISHASSNKMINELEVALNPRAIKKKQKFLEFSYAHAPFYSEGSRLMNSIINCGLVNLADFLEFSIRSICDYLNIQTKIIRTSSIPGNSEKKAEYRIFDICEYTGADTVYNAINGYKLYDLAEFEKRGLRLAFLKRGDIRYKQFTDDFIPDLSILDVIMFNPVEKIQEMLKDYSLITA